MAYNFLYSLSSQYLKLVSKLNSSEEPVDVFSSLAQAKHTLICLPDKLEDFGIARNFTPTLRDKFSHSKITFLVKQNYLNLLNKVDRENCYILSLNPEDITRFGLPMKQVIATIKKMNFDLAIDLNYEFNLTSTYICFISGANLRICLENKNRDPFFNFQVRTRLEDSIESKFRSFIKYFTISIQSNTNKSL